MSFKEMVEADCKNIFLNTDEFADKHTIWYDGDVFYDIPVILTKIKQKDRPNLSGNNTEGLHIATVRMYFAGEDVGSVPEQGRTIEIDDGYAVGRVFRKKYRIVENDCAKGMVCLDLEAYDE